jgi:glycosyltransferase involved in cell wall biosynthesis
MEPKGYISWFTPPLEKNQGYAVAAVETIHALQRKFIKVDWNDTTPYAHINFIQPEFYEGHSQQYRIGYTPWESTVIPDSWTGMMQTQDEIWTPSNFCKEVFDSYNVNKIVRVVPHGINAEMFPIVDRERTDKFIFLHIGGPSERKGASRVARAFVDVFDDIDDAFLIIKSHGPSEARWYQNRIYRGNIANHPKVQVFTDTMDEDKLMDLYRISHCCVYPSNGEGFGLIPFQAIATGLPTITTNLTAMADFASLSMPLEATWGEGNGVHTGMWAIPNEEHLRELMLDAYNNWETHKKKAMQSAKIIQSTQSWDHVATQILDILGDKINMTTDVEEYEGGGYTQWVAAVHGKDK